jgi:hypothetical protein
MPCARECRGITDAMPHTHTHMPALLTHTLPTHAHGNRLTPGVPFLHYHVRIETADHKFWNKGDTNAGVLSPVFFLSLCFVFLFSSVL